MKCIEEIYKEIENKYSTDSNVPDEAYRWCYDNAPDAIKKLPERDMLDMMLPLYQQYKRE